MVFQNNQFINLWESLDVNVCILIFPFPLSQLWSINADVWIHFYWFLTYLPDIELNFVLKGYSKQSEIILVGILEYCIDINIYPTATCAGSRCQELFWEVSQDLTVQAEREAMLTFFQTNYHLCKTLVTYINFYKNDGKQTPYSCLKSFQGVFREVPGKPDFI